MNVVGTVVDRDVQGVIGLATFLGDLEGCQSRLAELVAAAQAARDAETDAQKARNDAVAAKEDAQAFIEQAAKDMRAADSQKALLDAREADADRREQALAVAREEILADHKANQDRAAELDKREGLLDERTAQIEFNEQAVADLKAKYEAQLAALRAALPKE